MEFTTEQRRIIDQVRKHVSKSLADEIALYFSRGFDLDDLRYVIEKAGEQRKQDAALETWKEAWAAR